MGWVEVDYLVIYERKLGPWSLGGADP